MSRRRQLAGPTRKIIYLVIQEGGSSIEAYASTYDSLGKARDAMDAHAKATYRSKGPFLVTIYQDGRRCFVTEPDLLALVEKVLTTGYQEGSGSLPKIIRRERAAEHLPKCPVRRNPFKTPTNLECPRCRQLMGEQAGTVETAPRGSRDKTVEGT